jgi:hypothetical protein
VGIEENDRNCGNKNGVNDKKERKLEDLFVF